MSQLRPVVLGLIFLMFASPFGAMVTSTSNLAEEHQPMNAEGWDKDIDVPTWRIGDEWVYDTKFDVAQLIAQANVSASLNTLTGETTYTVADILFITVDGVQTLAYSLAIEGDFTSGNSGATLEGVSGRLDIGYSSEDLIRVRDLALINSEFTLDVTFAPFNLGFLTQDIAEITFDSNYLPPKEKHDFPLHLGDQWYMQFQSGTDVSGSSDYFDPSEFDVEGIDNNSWQITAKGIPTDGANNIQYTGCDESYKINEVNETGVSQGYNWYCPAVRYNSWISISNSAGFTIDWLLKEYNPSDSYGVSASSTPGTRNIEIDIDMQFLATLPDSEQTLSASYTTSPSGTPQANKNLQLRYELDSHLGSPTTDGNGEISYLLNVSNVVDNTPSSDDFTSNGVIVWDPATDIIGATTVVIDLTVVAVDLVAQADSIIVTRIRDGEASILSKITGYGALPDDMISFSIPAQNRGVLTSPATEIEVTTPDGTSIRENIPAISSYSEERITVNWTVPSDAAIGNQTLSFTVDPDELITEDANRSNNNAEINIFIGRAPTGFLQVDENKRTFENITLNATQSFDEDGGDVNCKFEIESRPGLIDVVDAPDCWTQWNWTDDGEWLVTLTVTDEELDIDVLYYNVTVINRNPYMNLTMVQSIDVEQRITVDATDSGDIDTVSPPGQQVSISWPGMACEEGLTQPTCTFTPMAEGPMMVTAVATDDDGATTTVESMLDVLNVAPTLAFPELWYGGSNLSSDANGMWSLDEDQVALLRINADDTLSDRDDINIEWTPSDRDINWTETTRGPASTATVIWTESGIHNISVVAYDDNGAQSVVRTASVSIRNVPPTITGLGSDVPILEDANVTFAAVVSDTASDMDSLVVCWDMNSAVDNDNDGNSVNDCEMEGLEITTGWSTRGIRQITATVTDNDGAQALASVNVSVQNLPPSATITNSTSVISLVEGDNITLSGLTSRETAGDKLNLIYQWDSDHYDSDLDGTKTGDVDFTGPMYTIDDLPAGQWTVTLTVTDDDGEFSTATIQLTVTEKPAEGFIESVSEAIGTVPTAIIGGLSVIVVLLAVFLLLTRRKGTEEMEAFSNFSSMPAGEPPAPVASTAAATPAPNYAAPEPQQDIYAQAGYAPTQQPAPTQEQMYAPAQTYAQQPVVAPKEDPFASLMATPQPAVAQAPAPAPVQSGPPLPATGLPEGWTMEQWNHYGAQYLTAQQGQMAVAQPTTTNTTPAPVQTDLSGLLDDFDL
jgi:hypothetical protein